MIFGIDHWRNHPHDRLVYLRQRNKIRSQWKYLTDYSYRLYHRAKSKARKVKQRGAFFIVLSFTVSIIVVPITWVKIALLVMLIVLLSWFMRLPVTELVADREENH